jgi:hypothetical protein
MRSDPERRRFPGADASGDATPCARLAAAYAELDEKLASLGAGCTACGECCRFPPGAPVLYATALERRCLLAVPPPAQWGLDERACPYLDEATSSCTARARRPVGCRAFYCDRALPNARDRDGACELGEAALRRIRAISTEAGIPWDYAPVVRRLRGGGPV